MTLDPNVAKVNYNPNQEKSKDAIMERMVSQNQINFNQKAASKKAFEDSFNKWRDYDLYTALIGFIGLAMSIVDYEYTWKQSVN